LAFTDAFAGGHVENDSFDSGCVVDCGLASLALLLHAAAFIHLQVNRQSLAQAIWANRS
jgi:hypothetical protein